MNSILYNKLSAYCSSAERCRADVEEKLRKAEASEEEKENILERLVAEGFIDERRYAKAFAADKFRFSKWGKRKIEFALRAKRVPENSERRQKQHGKQSQDTQIYGRKRFYVAYACTD